MPRISSAAIGLAVLVCGACAPHTSTGPDHGPQLTPAALELLTRSGGYPARAHALSAAEEQLVTRCMTARGETYEPYVVPLPPGTDEERAVALPRRRTEGYGLASDTSTAPKPTRTNDTPTFEVALFGDKGRYQGLRLTDGSTTFYPTTGCLAESRAALYGDLRQWARTANIPQTYDNTLRGQVKDAPELAEANARWSTCMAVAGYHYPTPQVAVTGLSQDTQPDPRTRESALATADGQCQLSTHLPGTELQLRKTAAKSLPAAQRQDLNELATLHCAAYRNALRVTGQHAPDCPQ